MLSVVAITACRVSAVLGVFCLAVAGCAKLDPLPLDTSSHLKFRIADLEHAGVPIGRRLTIHDVELLAVQNNPDLIAARFQKDVAQAQVLQAGILPNPSINGSVFFVLNDPTLFTSYALSLAQDIQKTITIGERVRGANAAAQAVDASILWQEWQTIAKARLLAVDLIEGSKLHAVLVRNRDLLQRRFLKGSQALSDGNATIATLSPDLAAVSDLVKQIEDLDRQQGSRRHDLNALLGLAPSVDLPLIGDLQSVRVDSARVKSWLPDLANRRPDLIALQLGYRSEESKVRGAIIGQFPAMTFGPAYSTDTSKIATLGPNLTMDLPIFDRNQGNIAIEKATRDQLRAEFNARLTGANSEILGTLADQELIRRQLDKQRSELSLVRRFTLQAEKAREARNLDERAYVDLVTAGYAKEVAIISLEQLLLEQQVAIASLIGAGMPVATLPDECVDTCPDPAGAAPGQIVKVE